MAWIHAAPGALDELSRRVPDGRPVALVNLLHYRERTEHDGEPMTGRECYTRYTQALLPALIRAGGRPVWRGQIRHMLIGPENEAWDEVIVIGYPSLAAFERMLADPGYEACAQLRTDALEDSRLLVATAPQQIGRLAWSAVTAGWRLRHLPARRARSRP